MAKKDYIWSDFNQEKLNTFCNETFSGNFGFISVSSPFPTENLRRLKELLGVDDITINVTYSEGAGIIFKFPGFYFYKINDNWLWFIEIQYQGEQPPGPYVAVKTRTAASITFTSNTSKYFRLKTQKSTGEYVQDTADKVTSITFTIDCTSSSTDWCNFNSSTGTITYNYKGDYCRFKEFNHSTDLEIWNAYLWDNNKQLFNSTYFESTNVKVSATQPTIPDRFNYNQYTNRYQATLPTFGYYGFGNYLYKFLSYPYTATSGASNGHYIFSTNQSYGSDISGKDFQFWAIKSAPKFQYVGHDAIEWIDNSSFASGGHMYYLKPGQKVFEFRRYGSNSIPEIEEENSSDTSSYGGPAFYEGPSVVDNNGATMAFEPPDNYPMLRLESNGRPALVWKYKIQATPYWRYREHYNGGIYNWAEIPSWANSLFHNYSGSSNFSTQKTWSSTVQGWESGYNDNRAYNYIEAGTTLRIDLSINFNNAKVIRDDDLDYVNLSVSFLSLSHKIWSSQDVPCSIISLRQSFNITPGIFDQDTLSGIYLIGQDNRGRYCHHRTYGQTGKGYHTIEGQTYTNAFATMPNAYADFRMWCPNQSFYISEPYYYIYDENGVDE